MMHIKCGSVFTCIPVSPDLNTTAYNSTIAFRNYLFLTARFLHTFHHKVFWNRICIQPADSSRVHTTKVYNTLATKIPGPKAESKFRAISDPSKPEQAKYWPFPNHGQQANASSKEEKPACFILTQFERTLHLPAKNCKDQSQDACYPGKYLPLVIKWFCVASDLQFPSISTWLTYQYDKINSHLHQLNQLHHHLILPPSQQLPKQPPNQHLSPLTKPPQSPNLNPQL